MKKEALRKPEPGKKPDQDYEAEDGLNTLIRASEIQKNKDLMGRVQALANKKKGHMTSIAQMKASWNDPEENEQEDTA